MKLRYSLLPLLGLAFSAHPDSASAQPKALVELFRNINCQNCRIPDDQYEAYLKNVPGVVQIFYHNYITDPSDPFYLDSKASVDERSNNFYKFGNDPAAVVDGFVIGSTESQWESATTTAVNTQPLAQLTLSSTTDQSTGEITFHVSGNPGGGGYRYFVALTESHIIFDNTELYGKLDEWNNMFRVMLPAPTGSQPLSGQQSIDVTFDPGPHPTWNLQNMQAIAFAQDVQAVQPPNSHQIRAIGVLPLNTAGVETTAAPGTSLSVALSDAGHVYLTANTREAAPATLRVYDMLGREVKNLDLGVLHPGATSLDLSTEHLTSGCYIARMTLAGNKAVETKVIVR